MGARIPKAIRRQVIREWLDGHSRDQIAKNNEIGAGTVSSIVDECRKMQPSLELQREVALKLKKENLTVEEFASSIRLTRMLKRMHITAEQIISLVDTIMVDCFKHKMSFKEYNNIVNFLHSFSKRNNVRFNKQFQLYITRAQNK